MTLDKPLPSPRSQSPILENGAAKPTWEGLSEAQKRTGHDGVRQETCHNLAGRGSATQPSPHCHRGRLSWLHNSFCGPLPPVPTPALEVVQSQMERSMGKWGWQSRESVALRKGASSFNQWGLGRWVWERAEPMSTSAFFNLPPVTWELPFSLQMLTSLSLI